MDKQLQIISPSNKQSKIKRSNNFTNIPKAKVEKIFFDCDYLTT